MPYVYLVFIARIINRRADEVINDIKQKWTNLQIDKENVNNFLKKCFPK